MLVKYFCIKLLHLSLKLRYTYCDNYSLLVILVHACSLALIKASRPPLACVELQNIESNEKRLTLNFLIRSTVSIQKDILLVHSTCSFFVKILITVIVFFQLWLLLFFFICCISWRGIAKTLQNIVLILPQGLFCFLFILMNWQYMGINMKQRCCFTLLF